uniref:Uncharacterized protein n=1 Tax=viral metagenome TaxID=1070528 RepID=A0A6C0II14_9ZZZZ
MTTEIILVELNVYEKNLNSLLASYESMHANYLNSARSGNIGESKALLTKLESLNQEIQLLSLEISNKINSINDKNDYGKYKDSISQKKTDLNTLNDKLMVDEKNIKDLMFDTIDLDGKNENLRVEHKSNIYYILFYGVVLILIIVYIMRMFSSSEVDPLENIMLFLGILLLIYTCWAIIINGVSSLTDTAKNNFNYDSSSLLYRMVN